VFIKYEAKVSSRVSGGERGVVDFGKLFTETNDQKFLEEFSLRNVHTIISLATSAVTAISIFQSFTYKTAAKINLHRYGAKFRHCHSMYYYRCPMLCGLSISLSVGTHRWTLHNGYTRVAASNHALYGGAH